MSARAGRPARRPNEFTALVSFSSGAVGVLQSSYATGRRIYRAEFHGPGITAYVDADRESYIVEDNGEPEVVRLAGVRHLGRRAG